MKSKGIHIISLFLCAYLSNAQPVWNEILESAQGPRYDDLFFLNETTGWAAGSGGNVFKTTDGGNSWVLQLHLDNTYIRNIEFLNENIGFLGTLGDTFYRTTDGGTTWNSVDDFPIFNPLFTERTICGMDAVGTHTIYACGTYYGPAYIVKTVDSGQTWTSFDMSTYAESLVEVLFLDENTGFASGGSDHGGIVLKTTDGGQTWNEIYSTGIPGEYVWKLQSLYSNPSVLFGAVESIAPLTGKLIKSIDSGANWISKEVPDVDIQAVGFVTENHGWMGGHHTGFLETFDSGTTWIDTGFGGHLNRIVIFNEELAYCSGSSVYKFSDPVLGNAGPNANTKIKNIEVVVFPNPVENTLSFSINYKSADHMVLQLFDSSGKLLKNLHRETIPAAGKKNYSFPFPYPPGTYYLNLHNDIGGQSEKIIKK